MVETDHTKTDEPTGENDGLAERLNRMAPDHLGPGGLEELKEDPHFYDIRRDVFRFAENFKLNDAGEYSDLYMRLIQDSALSERETQVAIMKLDGFTHDGILLFYLIMNSETAEDYEFPRAPSTINEYSQRAREKYRQAVATVNHLKPLFGDAELWNCPECGKRSAAPDTERGSKHVLKITCPHCGASDYQEGPGARFV